MLFRSLLLMLLPSALHGGAASSASVAVYSVVFVAYGLTRVGRALVDRREEAASVRSAAAFSDELDVVS